jgi:hypothetical protein
MNIVIMKRSYTLDSTGSDPDEPRKVTKRARTSTSLAAFDRTSQLKYDALREDEIRLLEILPGPASTMVSCRMFHVPLHDLPTYTALSYTWGNEPLERNIMVNNHLVLVTPNLEVAVREFRRKPVWFVPKKEPHRFKAVERSFRRLAATLSDRRKHCVHLKDMQKLVEGGNALVTSVGSTTHGGSASRRVPLDVTMRVKLEMISESVERQWNTFAERENLPLLHCDPQLIWIDALCINQSDLQERARQVNIMQKIYKGAGSLAVWLGIEDSGSSDAFTFIGQIQQALIQRKMKALDISTSTRDILADTAKSVATHQIWPSLKALFSRPWFARVWVIQEFALCPDIGREVGVTFCCGQSRVPDLLKIGLRLATESPKSLSFSGYSPADLADLLEAQGVSRSYFANFEEYRALYQLSLHSNRRLWGRYCLLPLVIEAGIALATDPRDMIYSVIGMAKEIYGDQLGDLDSTVPLIDYTATVEDVYSNFVKAVVQATQRLDVLGLCKPSEGHCIQRTWAPDWTRPVAGGILTRDILEPGQRTSEIWDWTFNVSPGSRCIVSFGDDLTTLAVSGIRWNEVIYASSNDTKKPSERNTLRRHCLTILQTSKKISGRSAAQDDSVTSLALLEALVLNRTSVRNNIGLTPDWVRHFYTWIEGQDPDSKWIDGSTLKEQAMEYIDLLKIMVEIESGDQRNPFSGSGSTFSDYLRRSDLPGSKIILTGDGHIGRCRDTVEIGDIVCVLLGCAMPIILRPKEGYYEVVCEGYLDGIMKGEAMEALNQGKRKLEEFVLR